MLFEVGSRILKLRVKQGINQGIPNFIFIKIFVYINMCFCMLGSFLGSKVEFCNLNVKKNVE